MEIKSFYLSDVLCDCAAQAGRNLYKTGNRLIVKAPCGAGKNYFCIHKLPEIMKQSDYAPEERRILFITSREATAEQVARELKEKTFEEGFTPSVRFGKIGEPIEKCNFIYGQSWNLEGHIAEYIQYAQEGRFAYVVIDECHSLFSDSTFAAAPVAVLDFLATLPPRVSVLLMSACPERIFDSEILSGYTRIAPDCHKVTPKQVSIIAPQTAPALTRRATKDNKIIYFVCDTKTAYEKEKKLNEQGVRAVAITSQKDKRSKIYNANEEITEQERLSGLVFQNLRGQEHLYSDIDIIIATTKLREGINIKDNAVKAVITDLRDSVSLIQCAGRVRQGVDDYYIIDSPKQRTEFDYRQKYYEAQSMLDSLNDTLSEYQEVGNEQKTQRFIRDTEKIHKGALYYLESRRAFVLNPCYLKEQELKWDDYTAWKENKEEYVKRVLEVDSIGYQTEQAEIEAIITPYCGRIITKEERKELIEKLNALLPKNKRVKSRINNIIKQYGYICEGRTDKRTYIIQKISENHTDI